HLPGAPGPRDEVAAAADDRADRRAQPLRKAERHGVAPGGNPARGYPDRGARIEDACSIEVDCEPLPVRDRRQVVDLREGDGGAAAAVVGVLEAQEAGTRRVSVWRTDRRLNHGRVDLSLAAIRQSVALDIRDARRSGDFVVEDVTLVPEQDFIT